MMEKRRTSEWAFYLVEQFSGLQVALDLAWVLWNERFWTTRLVYWLLLPFSSRLLRLLEEIMSEKENKTIIFVETKKKCDDLTRRMRRDGYVSSELHIKRHCVDAMYRWTSVNLMLQVACNGYTWRQEPTGERLGAQWYCFIAITCPWFWIYITNLGLLLKFVFAPHRI